MDAEIKINYLDSLVSVIENSYNIKRHVEFFTWLQEDISKFIPHETLLSVWGDFKSHETTHNALHYDLASDVLGISTRLFIGTANKANRCMTHLYHLWLANNCRWFALNYFANTEFDFEFRKLFHDLPLGVNSLLVYGVSDMRSGNECLYVFFSKKEKVEIDSSVLHFLMPHVDCVLRRIQQLDYPEYIGEPEYRFNMLRLTERELEVIDWIKAGKTNQEIAVILDISLNTVKSYIKRIFQKLNVNKRAQAVALLSSN